MTTTHEPAAPAVAGRPATAGNEHGDPGRASAARDTLRAFVAHGYTHFTGVPCSLLAGLFRLLEQPPPQLGGAVRYLPAPREDSALGVATGLTLAGTRCVVAMQNSGLGYCLNVLTSLNLIYDLHVPLVVSWRGYGGTDAVEHDVIGRELINLLDVFGLRHTLLDPADAYGCVERCLAGAGERGTPVLIVREGV